MPEIVSEGRQKSQPDGTGRDGLQKGSNHTSPTSENFLKRNEMGGAEKMYKKAATDKCVTSYQFSGVVDVVCGFSRDTLIYSPSYDAVSCGGIRKTFEPHAAAAAAAEVPWYV